MTTTLEFERLTAPHRGELLAHCYRMTGALEEAEDLVQEVYLRAWRSFEGFEGRSSVRTWLYRIATNACLNALEAKPRRPLPSGLGAGDPEGPWLDPLPDALVVTTSPPPDPAVVAAEREGLRLALLAGLQYLPPRQRVVLILRDVLRFPAADVAAMLEVEVPAVKSLLQRARARLAEVEPRMDDVAEPAGVAERAAVEAYVAAFERADVPALERVLKQDFALELLPAATVFAGQEACLTVFRDAVGTPGSWRMRPVRLNGSAGTLNWMRGTDGGYHPFGLSLLEVAPDGELRRVVVWGATELVERLAALESSGAPGR